MSPVLQLGDRTFTPAEVLSLIAEYRLMPQLAKEIVIEQAIAEIEYQADEIQLECQKLAQQYQISSDAALEEWLQSNDITLKQFENIAIRQVKLEKFKQLNWEGDIESYFLGRKPFLDRVVYSLIRTSDIGIAQELYFRIQEGEESFAQAARKYTEGPEAETDGLIGPVELQTIHPNLAKILSSIQPQQLLPPTKIGEWFVIVRLEKLIIAKLDRPMAQRLIEERFNQWLQEQINSLKWEIRS